MKEIDDHADLLGVTVTSNISIVPTSSNGENKHNNLGLTCKNNLLNTRCEPGNAININKNLLTTIYNNIKTSPASKTVQVTRKLCLSRFWKFDDDGVYLLTFNSISCDEFPAYIKVYPIYSRILYTVMNVKSYIFLYRKPRKGSLNSARKTRCRRSTR